MKRIRFQQCIGILVFLAGSAQVISEEPTDVKERLGCSYLEITGTAQGGTCAIGFTRNNASPCSIATAPGETAEQIGAKLAEKLRTEEKLTVDTVDGGHTLCVYNTKNGELYFHTTDAGLKSGLSVEDLRSESDPGSLTAKLTWLLPNPKPDALYVYDSSLEVHTVADDATVYEYVYPQSESRGRWFYLVCGYTSADDTRITKYSDLRKVWVDNPHKMTTRDLKIIPVSHPLSPFLGREYSFPLGKFGGTNPCMWSITKGDLPSGLSMDTNGCISGKASQMGLRSITVTLRDAKGAETSASIDVEVFDVPLYQAPKE